MLADYTSIPNSVLADERLSLEAKAMFAYLCYEDEIVTRSQILKKCNIGIKKYNRIINELVSRGHLIIDREYDKDGKLIATNWQIFEERI